MPIIMSIITLLTDFGLNDEYVGTMKGVILSVNPSATLIDITHNIDPHDIIQAAFTIKSSYQFFSKRHCACCDCRSGSGWEPCSNSR